MTTTQQKTLIHYIMYRFSGFFFVSIFGYPTYIINKTNKTIHTVIAKILQLSDFYEVLSRSQKLQEKLFSSHSSVLMFLVIDKCISYHLGAQCQSYLKCQMDEYLWAIKNTKYRRQGTCVKHKFTSSIHPSIYYRIRAK